jgi:type I restriction enzyme S subunit
MKKGGKLEGWKVEKLGDVCDIFNGGTPDTKVPKYWGGNILWITPKDMGKLESIYVDDTARKITDAGLKNSSARILPANSVILSSRAPIGHLAINTKEMTTNQGCKGIVPKKELSTLFLYYFLENSVELLNSLGSGTTFKELSASKLAEVVIPIPPLPEQQRIVSMLDEAFASIAQAKSNAERNLVNARELFETYLQSVFSNGNHWEEKQLGDICNLITDGKHGDCENQENSGYYFLSAKDVKNNTLQYEGARQITKKDFEETHRRTNLKPGDVLVTNSGTIGRMAIAPDDEKTYKTTFQKSVAIIKPMPSIIDNVFCCYHLQADLSKLVNVSAGTAQKNLLIGDLKRHLVKIPPLAEQRAIVGRLEALSAETGRLEEIYEAKVEGLEELKRSVLGKAFGGEL